MHARRGKSRNKVAVGEPAAGSFSYKMNNELLINNQISSIMKNHNFERKNTEFKEINSINHPSRNKNENKKIFDLLNQEDKQFLKSFKEEIKNTNNKIKSSELHKNYLDIVISLLMPGFLFNKILI